MSPSTANYTLFQAMAEHSPLGLLVFEQNSKVIRFTNNKANEILNLKELKENTTVSSLSPGESRNKKFKSLTEDLFNHQGLFQDMLIKKFSGESFIGTCGVRHLDVDGEKLVLLMLQDTTLQAKMAREIENKQLQIKTAYKELLEQNQQLKELDVAKTRFIALVTHELRTPTSAVVATSEMLKLGIYDDEAQMKEFIQMIHQEGKHLLELINDILDFAKIQNGKMDFFIEQQDVRTLMSEVAESTATLSEKSGIEFKYKASDHPLLCYFDLHRLKQVMSNLLSNGVKYNKENGELELYAERIENIVRIHIKDNGKGISKENQPLIFNEFETLGKMSTHSKGTGLGLPISKRMMESMGGTIGLASEEGKGSSFWIDIPTEKVLSDQDMYRSRPDDIEDLAA